MRRYETIFIIDPDLSAEERNPVFDRLNDLIPKQGGFLVEQDEWGSRKLAYEIKKKPRGYYVRLDYCGTGAVVDEMERLFRIDDRILKYMTIVLDKDVDTEKVKEEMASAESEQEPPDQIEPVQHDEPDAGPDALESPESSAANPDALESPESDAANPDAFESPESDAVESDTSSTESDEKE
ncbi:30S ribosomal protein S6 [Thermodesulfobacteriota bacterium]